jgi:hypothetical protein
MENEDLINKLKIYEDENVKLKEQLDKYKNIHKSYYEKNKEIAYEKGCFYTTDLIYQIAKDK